VGDIEAHSPAAVGPEPSPSDDEVESLKRKAWLVLIWLGAVIVGCGIGLAAVLRGAAVSSQRLAVLSLLAGALGSGIAALASAADRIAHGWELENGQKIPAEGAPDRFVRRMIPLSTIRPLLGAGAGMVAYFGLVGGLLFTSRSGETQPRTESVLFFATLAGLFAKTLIDRLKDTFDHFLGQGSDPG
jgi:hypothetical protein